MINVCSQCGAYRADKAVDSSRSVAVCPECAHTHPFRFTPLFLVGGASGAGKSALIEPLIRRQPPVVVLETDILWRPEFNKPDEQYRDYFETWLRLAKNIAQNGRSVLLLGAGFAVPKNIAQCVESRYFTRIHTLALTCQDDLLEQRLKARPDWRASHSQSFIDDNVAFNQWCRDQADQSTDYSVLDTSDTAVNKTVEQVLAWVLERSDKIICVPSG